MRECEVTLSDSSSGARLSKPWTRGIQVAGGSVWENQVSHRTTISPASLPTGVAHRVFLRNCTLQSCVPQDELDLTPHPAPHYLDLSDESLLRDCRFDLFRGPGPGGQKRNKTSNSVRLTHTPTNITVLAGESRSQSENKARAFRRLKLRLAVEIRHAIDPRGWEPPAWFPQVVQLGRLSVSPRNDHYPRAAALVLDLLDARKAVIGDVARLLGVSTSSVVKFLESEPQLWSAANALRKAAGQPPLEKRR